MCQDFGAGVKWYTLSLVHLETVTIKSYNISDFCFVMEGCGVAKKWIVDAALVDSMSSALVEMLPLLPKRLVRTDSIVRKHGMPFSQIQILVMLAQGPMSIGDVSGKLSIAKPNITPLVDNLRKHGLVERVRDAEDQRIVNVCLLPEGEAKLQLILDDVKEQIVAWPGEYSRSEMKELNNALATLLRFAKNMGE